MKETYRCYEIITKMYGEVKKRFRTIYVQYMCNWFKEEEEHVYKYGLYIPKYFQDM